MTDDLNMRRRRALWRATHRGTKELDILVGRYADAHIGQMDVAALSRFEDFLTMKDPDLQARLLAPTADEGGEHCDIIAAVRRFHGLEA